MTSNTSLENMESKVSRPQEDNVCVTHYQAEYSGNNMGEVSEEVIHEEGGVIQALTPLIFSTK